MYRIVLLSFVSLTTAFPITMTGYGGLFNVPFIGQFHQVDRSDEESHYNNEFANDQGYDNGQMTSGNGYNSGYQDYASHSDYGSDVQSGVGSIQDNGHAIPVSENVEVTNPKLVPVYKDIGVPVPQPIKINVPHHVPIPVPQPYPVHVPISKPVMIPIVKTVLIPVEKKVPYPVEKSIPVPIEKAVPIKIERHIPYPVFKNYPIKIPVYKTVHHHAKYHGHYH